MAEPVDIGEDEYEQEWGNSYEEEEVVEDIDAEQTDPKPELRKLFQQHPECNLDYIEQILPKVALTVVPPSRDREQEDPYHRTYPFLTVFERTKIIGLRANQLSKGAAPFIKVPKHVTDVRDIARLELEQRRLPFIVKRPLPNGTFEYWRLSDLLIL